MKFTCKAENLKEAVMKVEKIIAKQITLPILANILLSCENGRLVVSATNLEIGIKTYVGAKIEIEGEITIPAKLLSGFLSSIKDEVVSGQVKGTELEINSENHKMKLRGMDAHDFPIIPQMPQNIFFTINPQILSKAIAKVLISVAHNDTRQELNGIFIKLEKNCLVMAATDSFRLSEAVIKIDEKIITNEYLAYIDKNQSIIVPYLTLAELQRAIGNEDFEVSIDQNQLFVSNSNFKIISRLINGNYPEYRQVLPQKYDISVRVDRSQMLDAVKIAALVSSSVNGEVKISNSNDKKFLLISAQSMDMGDNLSQIPAEIEGEDFEVLFNCRYLADGLNIFSNEDDAILLKLNKQKSPVMIRSLDETKKENENYSYVIMPIIKG